MPVYPPNEARGNRDLYVDIGSTGDHFRALISAITNYVQPDESCLYELLASTEGSVATPAEPERVDDVEVRFVRIKKGGDIGCILPDESMVLLSKTWVKQNFEDGGVSYRNQENPLYWTRSIDVVAKSKGSE